LQKVFCEHGALSIHYWRRKREERNIHNSQSVDHLNCVAEETLPAPKSPNADSAFADSVYSDNDERAEASEVLEANFPIRTIKSSLQTLTNLGMEHPNSDGSDSGFMSCNVAFLLNFCRTLSRCCLRKYDDFPQKYSNAW